MLRTLRFRRVLRILGTGSALSLAVLGLGCTADQAVFATSPPGAELTLEVVSAVERGAWLDARVEGDRLPLRFFAVRDSGDCAAILESGSEVVYVDSGLRGELRRGDLRCAPQGFGSYRIDRGRTTRATGQESINPRTQANYRKVYEDDDLVLLRGRFPSATLIGWSGAYDTIVALGRSAACDDVADRNVASMEFRTTAARRLVLLAGDDVCPVEGLIQP